MEHIYKGVRINIHAVDDGTLYRITVIPSPNEVTKNDWLTQAWKYKNCASLARYFYKKHIEGKIDPSWLKKAEKQPEKHELHTQQGFIDWLNAHQSDIVGQYGSYDTPIKHYIEETRDAWKKSSFLVDGIYENRPRWMVRLDCFFQERLPDPEVSGYQVLILMQREKWDTKEYDLSAHMDRCRLTCIPSRLYR